MDQDLSARHKIIDLLKGGFLSAGDISRMAGIKEKEVLEHLPHVARTVNSGRDANTERFVVEPSECLSCGFVFKKRDRLRTPSRCPVCRSEEVTEMRFSIIAERKRTDRT